MPILPAAKKALRQSVKKRVVNDRRRRAMREQVKAVKVISAKKDAAGARSAMPKVMQAIDKAAKRGVIKKNTASRKKSRLAALLKKNAA